MARARLTAPLKTGNRRPSMERYQVILAYDGSHYKGFQRQANARSVQAVVENALRKVGWEGKSILAAGRTDTGVHALGQVIAFEMDWSRSSEELQTALNALLPSDVVARDVRQVCPSFHPRYDASWRKYFYRLYCQPVRQPLLEPYAWRVWPEVELSNLRKPPSRWSESTILPPLAAHPSKVAARSGLCSKQIGARNRLTSYSRLLPRHSCITWCGASSICK